MGWQPIETAPDDTEILAWGPDGFDCHVVERCGAEPYVWAQMDGPNYHKDAFTHWMPLPTPPEEAVEE